MMRPLRVGCIVPARLASSRLPGKVLLPAPDGRPLLSVLLARLQRCTTLAQIVVAVTDDPADEAIVNVAAHHGIEATKGTPGQLLRQFVRTCDRYAFEVVVRITADCPLVDPVVVDHCVAVFDHYGRKNVGQRQDAFPRCDYVGTSQRFPEGMDVDGVCSPEILATALSSSRPSDHEHITQAPKRMIFTEPTAYLPTIWSGEYVEPEAVGLIGNCGDVRLTVDEPVDYAVVYDLLKAFGPDARMVDYVWAYLRDPHYRHLNGRVQRNAGLAMSLAKEAA